MELSPSGISEKPLPYVRSCRFIEAYNEIDEMKAHNQGITNLQFLSNQNILITGGKDNKLRV